MIQWNFKMKRLHLNKLKTLTEQTSAVHDKWGNFSEKNYLYYSIYTNIEKVEIFHVLLNKVALLTRNHFERVTRNCHQITFRGMRTDLV